MYISDENILHTLNNNSDPKKAFSQIQ